MLLRKAARCVRHPSLVRFEIERRSRLREVSKSDFRPYMSAPISNNTYISLTSYGARLNAVHMAIRSLLMQSVRPSKVLLYLDESIQRDTLSDDLLDLEQYGLEIRMGYEDLGPHKKYLFAFQEFPDSLIITADDDLIYPADMVESLLTAHEAVPYCVVARRCHLIGFDVAGDLLPYEKWGWEHKDAFSAPAPPVACNRRRRGVVSCRSFRSRIAGYRGHTWSSLACRRPLSQVLRARQRHRGGICSEQTESSLSIGGSSFRRSLQRECGGRA